MTNANQNIFSMNHLTNTIFLFIFLFLFGTSGFSQNVGIGITTPMELLHVNGTSFHEGIKVDINNGASIMYIRANDGVGNYQRYWNTEGGGSPVRIAAGVAFNEHFTSITSNSTSSNYQMRYGGHGVAGSAISWSPGFSVNYDNGFFGIKTNTPEHALDVDGDARFQGNDIYGGTGNLRVNGGVGGYVELKSQSPTYGVIVRAEDGTGHFGNIEVANNTLGIGYRVSSGHLFIEQGGNVGIGKADPEAKLDVNGAIRWGSAGASLTTNQGAAIELRGTGIPFIDFSNDATVDYDARLVLNNNNQLTVQGADFSVLNVLTAKRMKVTATGYPDYVFEDDYDLKTLKEVEQHIDAKGHLPGVPSEKEIVETGLDLNDQSMWQMEKIEELFLHMIENEKRVDGLVKEVESLKQENQKLKDENQSLKNKNR